MMGCYESPVFYAETEIYKNAPWCYIFGEGGAVRVIYRGVCVLCTSAYACSRGAKKRKRERLHGQILTFFCCCLPYSLSLLSASTVSASSVICRSVLISGLSPLSRSAFSVSSPPTSTISVAFTSTSPSRIFLT